MLHFTGDSVHVSLSMGRRVLEAHHRNSIALCAAMGYDRKLVSVFFGNRELMEEGHCVNYSDVWASGGGSNDVRHVGERISVFDRDLVQTSDVHNDSSFANRLAISVDFSPSHEDWEAEGSWFC